MFFLLFVNKDAVYDILLFFLLSSNMKTNQMSMWWPTYFFSFFLLFNCRLSTWCTCPVFGFLLCIFDRWAAFQRANVAPGLQQLENFMVQWASKRIWCHGVTVWRLKLLYVGVSVFRKELQLSTEESEAFRACMLFQRCNMFYSNIY